MCQACLWFVWCFFFFFQAEDGIRDAQESRGLGDVYKRQVHRRTVTVATVVAGRRPDGAGGGGGATEAGRSAGAGRVRWPQAATRTADRLPWPSPEPVSYTHLRAHETPEHLVCR